MRKIIKSCAHCGEKFNATCGVAKFCSDRCHLLSNIKIDGECWSWMGGIDKDGYGVVRFRGRRRKKAHRASYEEFVGLIPADIMVCHLCDKPPCINPKHLFLGSAQANKDDCVAKARHVRGEKAHKGKLTEKQAREILASDEDAPILAARYGVHRNSIYYLKAGRTWKHLHG